MLLLLPLLACHTEPEHTFAHGGDGLPVPDDQQSGWTSGPVTDAGFGAAVTISRAGTWVGAPHADGGRVYRVDEDGAVEVLTGDGRVGSALLATGESFITGAPLAEDGAGQVRDAAGQVLLSGAGLALSTLGESWVAAGPSGTLQADGTAHASTARPSAIASLDGVIGVGMARGEHALETPSASWVRPQAQDEAGFAVTSGDVTGDGQDEWIVGAPGAGVVWLLDPSDLSVTGSIQGDGGRFGAALAVTDVNGDGVNDLLVGAPMAASTAGQAALYLGGALDTPDQIWTGPDEGDQLGFAVAADGATLVLGAPGGADSPGGVRVVSWEP